MVALNFSTLYGSKERYYHRLVTASLPTGWQQCADCAQSAMHSGGRRRKVVDMQLVACLVESGCQYVYINQSSRI